MNIQWYPGHMTKAKRMMQEDIKLIDIVVELIDARVPLSSKNPDIDELAKNKYRLIVLNKIDLADARHNEEWKEFFEQKGFFVKGINAKSGKGIQEITSIIQQACQEKIERDRKRGILNRPIRAMIVGIPNVGKSTFINAYAKKACTKVGNKPGVTKGKQWIKLNKNVEMLDTPGILWPKFEDREVGIRLAAIGSIYDEILDKKELALWVAKFLADNYQGMLTERYGIAEEADSIKVLEEIAENRGCLQKGNILDLDKAAAILLEEFKNGKLGKVTLEFPNII